MTEIRKDVFYSKKLIEFHAQHESKVAESAATSKCGIDPIPKRRRLFGPSEFWGQYSTQQEALIVASQRSFSSLQTFVYQNDQGYRKFIVAHPEVYWLIDECKPPEQRCSYEVITDGAPCHLYFDLEFAKDLNPSRNGTRMTKTLIDIFCAYFLEHWGFPCKRSDVLSLDSTTDVKFSRHLIFRVKNVMFKNNKHVGRFVRSICAKLRHGTFIDRNRSSDDEILKQFNRENLEELNIDTTSGKKLFVDEGVYTKNRHFRIYKSTKWGKNSHLIKSPDSEYVPSSNYKDEELGTFLDSLISYLPDGRNLVLLEYQDNGTVDAIKYSKECLSQQTLASLKVQESPYPDIDKFILDIVYPGKIRDVKYSEQQILLYSIADYRYCANIGRQHKSNGIYWVVDLRKKIAFQKCFDFDCKGFKSVPRKLPEETCFQFDEENDILLASVPEPQVLNGEDLGSMPEILSDKTRFQLDDENDMLLAAVPEPARNFDGKALEIAAKRLAEKISFQLDEEDDKLLASVPEPQELNDKDLDPILERLSDKTRFQLYDENDMLLATVPDPQDDPKRKIDTIIALEDDSLDAELTKIEVNESMS